jgi:nicotinate-nucleotide adenylyltransferase
VLIDYGFLIVHLFYDFVRQEYALEELIAQAKPLFKEDSQ